MLVADDEDRIRELLRLMLENRGYEVHEAEDGRQAFKAFKALSPDLVVLDVMMPGMDGIECCRLIREVSKCPILMLTARGEDYDQVGGLDSGADDYVIKPFTPMVLAARIEALLRRAGECANAGLIFGKLRIDPDARSAFLEGENMGLNRKEFDLLRYMAENHNISLSRDHLLEKVWGYDYLGSDSTIDTHVNRLRKKMGNCGEYIRTIRGYGYRFEV
ncbi:MAG: response regulator transcription factor [Clostridia bacterium]|nr:response regulator transcription factor [Clostridia bacterium]